jgi:hypothetical protein
MSTAVTNRLVSASICLLVAASRGGSAQQLLLTAAGGRTAAHFAMSYDLDQPSRVGWAASLGLRLHLYSILSLQVEASLVNRGDGADLVGVHSRYFEVPIVARLEVPLAIIGFTPSGLVGIAPAGLVRCRAWEGAGQMQSAPSPPSFTLETACRSYFTDVYDLGAVVGFGIERRIGGMRLGIELRHTRGLRNIESQYSCCATANRTTSLYATAAWSLGNVWRRLPNHDL